MPVNIEALGIDRLSVRERLDLIEQIWDSLPEQLSPEEVPPWHLAELARRRQIPVTSLNNHLAWSRRMLRAYLTGRLRGVTSGNREWREEIRAALRDP